MYGITTDMGVSAHYDDEGRLHYHDPNHSASFYLCRNGHEFGVPRRNTCWCGWSNDPATRKVDLGSMDPAFVEMTKPDGSTDTILRVPLREEFVIRDVPGQDAV